MTSPISVLLIIGAAVVGPVESQKSDPRVLNCGTVVSSCQYESLSQLCERAMREIGAVRLVIEGDDKGWWLSPRPGEYGASESVRCIPTPTGYRK